METIRKLAILADAAKYDASCASSGSGKRDSRASGGIGSTEGMGICHSYTPDGRCVSLLKILLTNFCVYDCAYCVNRVSSNVPRARFSVDEVVTLTLDFYKRNYTEGLFLSSGIIRNADYTMEQMVEVARQLREEHRYAGYIHLKTIPEASPELLASAGRYADRLSINVELPTEAGLSALAPEKTVHSIRGAMGELRWRIEEAKEARKAPAAVAPTASRSARPRPPRFAPAGQSTQMIVGADGANDQQILASADSLYGSYRMRRVYYSAFSPIPDASRQLPLQPPPPATRAPAVPGRLAVALLWLRRGRDHRHHPGRNARSGYRSEDGLGDPPSRTLPGRSEPCTEGNAAAGARPGRAQCRARADGAPARAPARGGHRPPEGADEQTATVRAVGRPSPAQGIG